MTSQFVCAVDVGTTSARAGIFDRTGALIARAEHPILINLQGSDRAEHDSQDIWSAVCHVVRAARAKAQAPAQDITAIGFDATCSLVVRGARGAQIACNPSGETRWDTICWFDHRAQAEARECSQTGHRVLQSVGGVMSPEMQVPKLMWLKRNLPESWAAAHHFFDLADFLTWKASGSNGRSVCTLACKWTYLPDAGGWQRDFFDRIGLEDMRQQGGLPFEATPAGTRVGVLTPSAAQELGLTPACVVSTGMIDAYSGMIGVVGVHAAEPGRLALVAGTSSCVMMQGPSAVFMPSFWGPYKDVCRQGLWVIEGGQSATGALLDHLVSSHAAGGEPSARMHRAIVDRIASLRSANPDFGSEMHVLPDFHGNRSPLGAPEALGSISGMTLDGSFDALCKVYWRSCVAIALGVRHILDHMRERGATMTHLHIAGGHTRNPILMQLYADATSVDVVECGTEDAVLLGTAMTAKAAISDEGGLPEACAAMNRPERIRKADPTSAAKLDRDYRAFLLMHRQQAELRKLSSY